MACGATHTLTLAENGQVYVFGDYSSSNDHQEPTPLLGNTYNGEGEGQGDAYTMVKRGNGKLHTLSDEIYEGAWDRNVFNGYGVYSFPNGARLPCPLLPCLCSCWYCLRKAPGRRIR